jgi:Legionella pneumophila major outer membrane protein precursor
MSLRVLRVAAPALSIAIIAIATTASAQPRSRLAYQGGNNMTPTPQPQAVEQLPPGHMSGGMDSGGPYSSGMDSGGPYPGGYGGGCGPNGCCEGEYCGDGCYGCDDGCCDTCGGYGCDGSCWSRGGLGCDMFGWVCPPGKYYVTADYLYARANFSSSISYLEQIDDQQQGVGQDIFHSLDFAYESSYRVGGGYRLCNCGEELRFMFTRLSSTANDAAPFGSFLPYEVTAEPGGETRIHADVDVKSYDLDYAKTIQLGGGCCECGDACGGCGCPAWDITWTGGFRFADVSWNRTYDAVNSDFETTTDATSVMQFRGGGLKMRQWLLQRLPQGRYLVAVGRRRAGRATPRV